MSRTTGFFAVPLLLFAGCNSESQTMNGTAAPAQESDETTASGSVIRAEATSSVDSDAITDGKVELNPSNTHIGWVGTHTGDDPKPRVGSFEEFAGVAEIDPDAKTLKSISVEIETASLKSPIDNLTAHLNSPDFFDTREYPKASFKSTKIGDDGTITGDLTLHGVTKEITFPATVTVNEAGLSMKADFTIDRTDFKLGEGQDRVEKEVQINVTVGDVSSDQLPVEQSSTAEGNAADDASSAPSGGGANP